MLAALAACGGSGTAGSESGTASGGTTPSALQSLTLSPYNPSMVAGGSEQLSAIGVYSGQSTADMTTLVTWSSSDTTKVSVSNQGVITAVTAGTATITADYNGLSSNSTVTVVQPNPSPAPPLSQSVTYQIVPHRPQRVSVSRRCSRARAAMSSSKRGELCFGTQGFNCGGLFE